LGKDKNIPKIKRDIHSWLKLEKVKKLKEKGRKTKKKRM
jgi:hypothetical protein